MNKSFLLASLLASAHIACGDDTATCDLPKAPQLSPATLTGVIGFDLTLDNQTSTVDAVFFNGGCDPLVIELKSLALTGDDASNFSLGQPTPENGRVAARGAFGVPVTFHSPGLGVSVATLSLASNAANSPTYEIELVGPGAVSPPPSPPKPHIAFIEDPVPVEKNSLTSTPAALVRFYNLGNTSLTVTGYSLADDTNFAFLRGTAQPSAACDYDAICGPGDGADEGCCEGGLKCRCLEFETNGITCVADRSQCANVNLISGQFNILGVELTAAAASGHHETDLSIESNDPDQPVATVKITGDK